MGLYDEGVDAISPLLDPLSPSVPAPSKSRRPDLSGLSARMAGRLERQQQSSRPAARRGGGEGMSSARNDHHQQQQQQRSTAPRRRAPPKMAYTSKFLQEAQKRAAERSAQKLEALRQKRRQAVNEWDMENAGDHPPSASSPSTVSPQKKPSAAACSLAAAKGK